MPAYKAIKVGKALNLDDLKRQSAPRGREASPRDVELAKLVNEVAAGPQSAVVPWEYAPTKVATARLAANRIIKNSGLVVYASTRPDYPGVILFSRVPLNARQKPKK